MRFAYLKLRGNLSLLFSLFLTGSYATYYMNRTGLDRNWDRAMYHDYVARALQHGWLSQDWLAAGLNTWISPFGEWPLLISEHLFSPNLGGKVLGIMCAVATTLSVWILAKEVFPGISEGGYVIGATLLSITSPFFLGEIGTTFQNWLTTPFILFGIQQLLRANRKGVWRNNVIAGGCLGVAVAVKTTNFIYLLAALCLYLFLIIGKKQSKRKIRKAFTGFVLGSSLALVPFIAWSSYVYSKVKNPVFPFFNAIFKSPYYAYVNFRDLRWHSNGIHTLWTFLTGWHSGIPFSELPSFEPVIFLFSWSLLIALFVVLFTRRYSILEIERFEFTSGHYFLAWYCISLILWTELFFYSRYLEPIEVGAGVAFATMVRFLVSSTRRNILVSNIFLFFGILFSFMLLFVPNWTHASAAGDLASKTVRWESPLTSETSKSSGILLTSGNPTAFLRLSSPKIEHMIRVDFDKLPKSFTQIIVKAFDSKSNIFYVRGGSSFNGQQISTEVSSATGMTITAKWQCKNLEGPIAVPYQLCKATW
jgi:hypothetical protein